MLEKKTIYFKTFKINNTVKIDLYFFKQTSDITLRKTVIKQNILNLLTKPSFFGIESKITLRNIISSYIYLI